jgi:hypothetical protein
MLRRFAFDSGLPESIPRADGPARRAQARCIAASARTGLFDIVKRKAPNRARMLASILPAEATRARPVAEVVRCRLVSCAALPHRGIVNNNEITMRALEPRANFALRRAALCAPPGVPASANNNEQQCGVRSRTRGRFAARRHGERLAERTHVPETQQWPGSARDRRSVPPNRRLPTVPRRRYYSLSKFSRSSQPASPAADDRA